MPNEITQGDFEKMQEQAIKRVAQMKQKANERPQSPQAPPIAKSNASQNRQGTREQTAQNEKPTHLPSQGEKKSVRPEGNPLSKLLGSDVDLSMILPLLLLLQKDGADEMLIMALLYIMT